MIVVLTARHRQPGCVDGTEPSNGASFVRNRLQFAATGRPEGGGSGGAWAAGTAAARQEGQDPTLQGTL